MYPNSYVQNQYYPGSGWMQNQSNIGTRAPPPIGFVAPNVNTSSNSYQQQQPYYAGVVNHQPGHYQNYDNSQYHHIQPYQTYSHTGTTGVPQSNIIYGQNYQNCPPTFYQQDHCTAGSYSADLPYGPGPQKYDVPQNGCYPTGQTNLAETPERPKAVPTAPSAPPQTVGRAPTGHEGLYQSSTAATDRHISPIPKPRSSNLDMSENNGEVMRGKEKLDVSRRPSAEYQKGLDKFAELMNEDVALTPDKVNSLRDQFDLNKNIQR